MRKSYSNQQLTKNNITTILSCWRELEISQDAMEIRSKKFNSYVAWKSEAEQKNEPEYRYYHEALTRLNAAKANYHLTLNSYNVTNLTCLGNR